MKTLILKSVIFLSFLFLNDCFGTDDIDEDSMPFLEKQGGTVWVIDEGNGYISYLRINNDQNNYIEDWYSYPTASNGCYVHKNYQTNVIDDNENLLVLEVPSESLTITFSVKDNILKVVAGSDISYWDKSSINVDGFSICTGN